MELSFYDKLALSTFTSLEKQSMYQLLCGAMIVDGARDSREVEIINEINRIMQFTVEEQQASRRLSHETMVNTLRSMDTLKKAYVAKFMAQVIIADGVITDREEKFFYYISQALDLPNLG